MWKLCARFLLPFLKRSTFILILAEGTSLFVSSLLVLLEVSLPEMDPPHPSALWESSLKVSAIVIIAAASTAAQHSYKKIKKRISISLEYSTNTSLGSLLKRCVIMVMMNPEICEWLQGKKKKKTEKKQRQMSKSMLKNVIAVYEISQKWIL